MSIFDKSPLLEKISGKTENLVFSSWRGIPYVKRRVYPINTYTTDRDIARSALARLVTMWKQSPNSLRESWRFYHSQQLNSGYNRFISSSYADERSLLCLSLLPPSPVQSLKSFNAIPTGWQTEVDLHFTPNVVPSGKSMYIFFRPSPFALDRSVEFYDKFFISGTTSPIRILLPYSDSTYQVYACLQDNVSQILSASLCTEIYILGDIMQVAYIVDRKVNGVDGGASTSATWHTRDLTFISSTIPNLTLSSNQISFPQGDYLLQCSAPAYKAAAHKIALYDVGGEAYVFTGTSEQNYDLGYSSTRSFLNTILTIPETTLFELRHYILHGYATKGLGFATGNDTGFERYTEVSIFRLS